MKAKIYANNLSFCKCSNLLNYLLITVEARIGFFLAELAIFIRAPKDDFVYHGENRLGGGWFLFDPPF